MPRIAMPVLPSVQVNMHAGHLRPGEVNGVAYVKSLSGVL